ncbi:hypothetical protein F0365_02050 [Nonlabens sp. Ci31]|uniref:hypothetical protein n=1 Tax=Nonlabens sp. Ci31 TaxID=2608253 RepID=UPI0014649906|nr:hypothetical protein [Nonlabens sp. Ci31]QJP33273.1 hypothetical protein F0365_02050 [Nonlabens sp. Ci31]
MKFKILFLLALFSSCLSIAQEREKKGFDLDPWEDINAIRVSSNFIKDYEAEVSYLVTSYPKQEPGYGAMVMRVQYAGLGLEYLRLGNKNVLGFKASYEESFAIFAAQIAADYLTTFEDSQFRISPKIGLSIFGFVTLYYGWNFDLLKSSSIQTRNQFLTLQLNIFQN